MKQRKILKKLILSNQWNIIKIRKYNKGELVLI